MAGTVFVSDIGDERRERWTATGWLFDFVLRQLADTVDSVTLSQELAEIVDENLGALDIVVLAEADQLRVLTALTSGFAQRADNALPLDVPSRDAALEHIDDLVQMARRARL